MRPYLRKIFICLIPVLLSLWAIWYAVEHERFKLGVDLSGGTILVYEIDTRKVAEANKDGKESISASDLANRLAEKLKQRIDPNDLYNIVIRPSKGEGRVEIILPTGGPERAERAEQQWRDLVKKMGDDYGIKDLDVNRGRNQELAERIQQTVAERTWQQKLYNTDKAIQELANLAEKPNPSDPKKGGPLFQKRGEEKEEMRLYLSGARERAGTLFGLAFRQPFQAAAVAVYQARVPLIRPTVLKPLLEKDKTPKLRELIKEVKDRINDFAKEREIDAWFKEQAWVKVRTMLWEEMIKPRLKEEIERDVAKELDIGPKLGAAERELKTKQLVAERSAVIFKDRKEQIDNILPDSFNELIGRAVTKGDSVGQAFARSLQSLLRDDNLLTGKDFLDRKKVEDYLVAHYGPSLQSIEEKIENYIKKSKEAGVYSRDLTVEEVQRIKELISKVGSLEFRILANNQDDKAAIAEAKAMLAANKDELDIRQVKGLPPPPPTVDGRPDGKPKPFDLTTLPRGYKSKVTYSWVELGPQERKQLGLNNDAENAAGGSRTWFNMSLARGKREATELNDVTGKKMLQGALFYSRDCKDRNLPEEERRRKKYEYFVLARNPELDPATNYTKETPKIDGSYLVDARNQITEGRPAVSFMFNVAGGALFRDLTRKNVPSGAGEAPDQVKRHLAIILDGLVVSAPTINSEIGQHGQISGSFTAREVDALVNILRSGALPATLKTQPVSENTMGATLGRDTIALGVRAIIIAFLAVMGFMIVYYRFAGLVASVALTANLIITVGFMVAVSATFTLPGLAGLVLMLGMAVDANVLIYERLREERERGASLTLALRNGYDRAFPTIIDTHLSSIFTAIVLYIVGNDQLKGFGVSLTVGLIISLFTSLYMTRLIFDVWNHLGLLKKLSMFKLFSRPDIDFMAIRYYWFTATIVLTLLGLALFIGRLPNDLNIDFVGGTAYAGQLVEPKNIDQLRELLGEKAQATMLKHKDKASDNWVLPKVSELDARDNRYELSYPMPDGTWTKPRTVALANTPAGDTKAAREATVQAQASVLPDMSVEQIFVTEERQGKAGKKKIDPDKSYYFNVRTSEKEPELVQAALDQLLQEKKGDKWHELLKKVNMDLTEDRLDGTREVRLAFASPDPDQGGKYVPHYASPSFVRTLFTRELLDQFKKKETRELDFQYDLTTEGQTKEGRATQMRLAFTPHGSNLTADQIAKIRAALAITQRDFADRPQPERLETFDSQLAAETRLRAMYAILLSWGAILVYLWFRFGNWTFGLATVLCLMHDLFFTLGIIAACHYLHGTWLGNVLLIEDFKIDLPAVAALLTLVGYSVNDTIVVFDRIREVRGKNPDLTPQMINDSVNQTLSRTLLTAFTVWLVVFVIYVWGGPGLHLFSFVMLVGVIVGTYSSIYIASPLLLIFGEGARATAKARDRAPVPVGAPDTRIQPAQ
jgi:SecD/SecF fusion protein